ncbi:hypothetical protein C5F50_01950 [Nitrosopumilus ureiphilus]|uniref:Uncharacterized protein n=1 Tax=Nitrosopumilus ureiphilus TaxID=1470067 RepID=A0A7D5M4A8_9ARCH|nr:hypothetical protein C5F50_01950 [Nitrosopumilus ureiphilus]
MINKEEHEQYLQVIKMLVDKKLADSNTEEKLIRYETQEIYLKLIKDFFKLDPTSFLPKKK